MIHQIRCQSPQIHSSGAQSLNLDQANLHQENQKDCHKKGSNMKIFWHHDSHRIYWIISFGDLDIIFSYLSYDCQHSKWIIMQKFSDGGNGILLPKLFWPTVRKNCSSDREKLLKFDAEGREFAKHLRSLEQFIQTVKGQNNFC